MANRAAGRQQARGGCNTPRERQGACASAYKACPHPPQPVPSVQQPFQAISHLITANSTMSRAHKGCASSFAHGRAASHGPAKASPLPQRTSKAVDSHQQRQRGRSASPARRPATQQQRGPLSRMGALLGGLVGRPKPQSVEDVFMGVVSPMLVQFCVLETLKHHPSVEPFANRAVSRPSSSCGSPSCC